MTLELQLSSDLEAQLRKQAADSGQDLSDFVLQAISEKLVSTRLPTATRDDVSWSAMLSSAINMHPRLLHATDDRRESIYAGRGE